MVYSLCNSMNLDFYLCSINGYFGIANAAVEGDDGIVHEGLRLCANLQGRSRNGGWKVQGIERVKA